MIRIIISELIQSPRIERAEDRWVEVWVSPEMSYQSIEAFIHEHLTFPEIQVIKKLWTIDDAVRLFEIINGNLEITGP